MAIPEKIRPASSKSNTATTAIQKTPAPPFEKIALRAYQLWQESGCPEGKHDEHWFRAERELRGGQGRSTPS